MTAINIWLYNSGFSEWIRESGSLWAYPFFLFLHSIGLGMLVGLSCAFALRILGVAKQLPVAPFEKLFPFLWVGLAINAVSGVVLYVADAPNKFANPLLYVKLAFVALAVTVLGIMRSRVFKPSGCTATFLPRNARFMAAACLILWTGAITAGRFMAYWKETTQ